MNLGAGQIHAPRICAGKEGVINFAQIEKRRKQVAIAEINIANDGTSQIRVCEIGLPHAAEQKR